jgi:D-alanyl-D-alanine dipeptidase
MLTHLPSTRAGPGGSARRQHAFSTTSRMIRPVLPLLVALLLATAPAAPGLVDVGASLPDVVLDIRYATADNFVGRPLYPAARCLLLPEAAERLSRAAAALRRQGYRLLLFDCYRPLSVQRELWRAMPKRGFVADPATGSHHNRAAAVDLALTDLAGAPVEMPTGFDDFGPRARAWATDGVSRMARRHRDMLRDAMTAAGFTVNPVEWWHFDAPGTAALPLLDLPLDGEPGAGAGPAKAGPRP